MAETIGTGDLLVALVGSGIQAQRLAAGQPAIVLLVNAFGLKFPELGIH